MTSRVATILDLIDTALADPGQHSPESHQYADVAPTMPAAGTCWRCTTHPVAEGSELCAGCRSYLLEDSDHDPVHAPVDWQTINREQWERGTTTADTFGARMAEITDRVTSAYQELTEISGGADPAAVARRLQGLPSEITSWDSLLSIANALAHEIPAADRSGIPLHLTHLQAQGIVRTMPGYQVARYGGLPSAVFGFPVLVDGSLPPEMAVDADAYTFGTRMAFYQARMAEMARASEDFEEALQRLHDALGGSLANLRRTLQSLMDVGTASANQVADYLIRSANLADSPDPQAPPKPRNRRERRGHQPPTQAPTAGPRPAWTHRAAR